MKTDNPVNRKALLRLAIAGLLAVLCGIILSRIGKGRIQAPTEPVPQRAAAARDLAGESNLRTAPKENSAPSNLPSSSGVRPVEQPSAQNVTNVTHEQDKSGSHWIRLAEKACVPNFDYVVEVSTQIVPGTNATALDNKSREGQDQAVSMAYLKGKGLRQKSPSASGSFSVDVASLLTKLKGEAEWKLEEKQDQINGEECVRMSASGDQWLVRLWIRSTDGGVLGYDQYLNNAAVASSRLSYTSYQGSLLPTNIVTRFPRSNRTIFQNYLNYQPQ